MMLMDISLIGRNEKYMKYENSMTLTFFYKKTNLKISIILTILTEICLIIIISFSFTYRFDLGIMSILCGFVGIVHIDGFYKTRKFITSCKI